MPLSPSPALKGRTAAAGGCSAGNGGWAGAGTTGGMGAGGCDGVTGGVGSTGGAGGVGGAKGSYDFEAQPFTEIALVCAGDDGGASEARLRKPVGGVARQGFEP